MACCSHHNFPHAKSDDKSDMLVLYQLLHRDSFALSLKVFKRIRLQEKVVTLICCNSIFAVEQLFWKEIEKVWVFFCH
jgi:hypothetical protein